jgi:hypothetical protein
MGNFLESEYFGDDDVYPLTEIIIVSYKDQVEIHDIYDIMTGDTYIIKKFHNQSV